MGRHDSPLTDRGIAQAKALANAFTKQSFAAIYSSPLNRAYMTAQLICETLHADKPITITDLQERSYGSFETKPGKLFATTTAAWKPTLATIPQAEQPFASIAPDVESNGTLLARTVRVLTEIADRHIDESVLIVSHGALLRTFLASLGNVDERLLIPGGLPNASYIVVTYTNDRGFQFDSIHEINDSHLAEAV